MNGLDLTVAVTADGGSLDLHYEVSNSGDRDVYLLNRLFRTSPTTEMSADIAYVDFSKSHRLARVRKGIFAIPPGASGPTVPVAPYVSPVRAGQRFAETIHLPLPLKAYAEYGLHLRAASNVTRLEMQGVILELDWYGREAGVSEKESLVYGETVILPMGYKRMPAINKLVSETVAARFPADVPG